MRSRRPTKRPGPIRQFNQKGKSQAPGEVKQDPFITEQSERKLFTHLRSQTTLYTAVGEFPLKRFWVDRH